LISWLFVVLHFCLVVAQAYKDFLPSILRTMTKDKLTTYMVRFDSRVYVDAMLMTSILLVRSVASPSVLLWLHRSYILNVPAG
jgi:hypothetical protein